MRSVTVRFEDADLRLVEEAARVAGSSLRGFCRAAAILESRRILEEAKEATFIKPVKGAITDEEVLPY